MNTISLESSAALPEVWGRQLIATLFFDKPELQIHLHPHIRQIGEAKFIVRVGHGYSLFFKKTECETDYPTFYSFRDGPPHDPKELQERDLFLPRAAAAMQLGVLLSIPSNLDGGRIRIASQYLNAELDHDALKEILGMAKHDSSIKREEFEEAVAQLFVKDESLRLLFQLGQGLCTWVVADLLYGCALHPPKSRMRTVFMPETFTRGELRDYMRELHPNELKRLPPGHVIMAMLNHKLSIMGPDDDFVEERIATLEEEKARLDVKPWESQLQQIREQEKEQIRKAELEEGILKVRKALYENGKLTGLALEAKSGVDRRYYFGRRDLGKEGIIDVMRIRGEVVSKGKSPRKGGYELTDLGRKIHESMISGGPA